MGLAASRQEAFWEACGFGDKLKVKRFIAEGVDVNWVSYTVSSTYFFFFADINMFEYIILNSFFIQAILHNLM